MSAKVRGAPTPWDGDRLGHDIIAVDFGYTQDKLQTVSTTRVDARWASTLVAAAAVASSMALGVSGGFANPVALLLVTAAAYQRRESRGGHCRSDYPQTDTRAQRTFLTLAEARAIAHQATGITRHVTAQAV